MAEVANTLRPGVWSLHRKVTGAPVGADPAVSASFPDRRALLNAMGYQTVMVRAKLTGGAAPTVSLRPILYDIDDDSFAKHIAASPIADGEAIEMLAANGRVFVLITATTGAPTAVELRVSPGARDEKEDA